MQDFSLILLQAFKDVFARLELSLHHGDFGGKDQQIFSSSDWVQFWIIAWAAHFKKISSSILFFVAGLFLYREESPREELRRHFLGFWGTLSTYLEDKDANVGHDGVPSVPLVFGPTRVLKFEQINCCSRPDNPVAPGVGLSLTPFIKALEVEVFFLAPSDFH